MKVALSSVPASNYLVRLAGEILRCACTVGLLCLATWSLGCNWRQDVAGLSEAWDSTKNLASPQQGGVSPKAQSIEKELQR